MAVRTQHLELDAEPSPGRFARRVRSRTRSGVGTGPRARADGPARAGVRDPARGARALLRQLVAVAVALVRDPANPRRERLEFACAPDVHLEQGVEELLFHAYTLYRQVDLTFEAGRDRALCLQMVYGVIAGLFKELDRAAATQRGDRPVECARVALPRDGLRPRRGLLPARRPAARAAALPHRRDRRPERDRRRRVPARARPRTAARAAGPVRDVPRKPDRRRRWARC